MLRCSAEAFAKCPTRHLCGTPHEATFTEGSECDKFNQQVLDKPMTKADRIRAMSDEELAEYLTEVESRRRGDRCGAIWGLPYVALEWLQQPAEGEKT